MNGFNKKLAAGAFLAGACLAAGCKHGGSNEWNWHGDPCSLERYAAESRHAVVAAFEPQVENGHVLDQTIWNAHFDRGSDRLNAAGMDKLDQLARRRPAPDTRVFLQTARDIDYNAEKPADYAASRVDLDAKRTAAVKKYWEATLTGRPAAIDVQIHDPSKPGIDVVPGVAPRVVFPAPADRAAGAGLGAGGAANRTQAGGPGTGGTGGPGGTGTGSGTGTGGTGGGPGGTSSGPRQ